MSLKKSELLETNKYELTFDVDASVFNAAIEKVYRKKAKNINVPGFRRGKASRSIIEKIYGKGVFYEDAINDVIPAAYEEASKESKLVIVGNPEFDVESVDENGVVLKAVVYTKPEVKIENYKGIPAVRPLVNVTEDEINDEIERVRDRNSRMIEVSDRAAQNQDTVNINFEGFADGKAFEGGKAENHDLILGSGHFIPGFEDQIIGHNIGDEFDVNVTFPADYNAENLAGKPAVFKCKLNSIKYKELPTLDDEFARDVSEFDTLDEYKADVKAKIEERKNKSADSEVEGQIINSLMEKLEADIPECMFEVETENFVRDYDSRLRMQGLDLNSYFKYTGMNLDSLRTQLRPQAENQVKTRLALEKVAELESISATDEEVEEEIKKMAEAYNMEADKVKEMVSAEAVAEDIKVKKAVDFIKENASVKDAEPETEKSDKSEKADKPEKKTTAKKTSSTAKKSTSKTTSAKSSTAKKTTTKKAADSEAKDKAKDEPKAE